MFVPESFKAASEAAEAWVKEIANARHFAEQGNSRVAYGILLGLSQQHNQQHDSVLWDARDDLAAISDGVIRYNGLLGPRGYASAHEAISEIVKVILIAFLSPLDGIKDADDRERMMKKLFDERWEGLVLSADLQARIRRERAKLLQSPAPPDTENKPVGEAAKDEATLKSRVLNELTEQQRKLVEYLWQHERGASFDTIKNIPGAFQLNGSPSDQTIKDKVKAIRLRLDKAGIRDILKVSGHRLMLDLPPG